MIVGADGISGERERGTLEVLLLTPASRRQLILGKLLASLTPWPAAFLISLPALIVVSQGDEVIGQAVLLGATIGTATRDRVRRFRVTGQHVGQREQDQHVHLPHRVVAALHADAASWGGTEGGLRVLRSADQPDAGHERIHGEGARQPSHVLGARRVPAFIGHRGGAGPVPPLRDRSSPPAPRRRQGTTAAGAVGIALGHGADGVPALRPRRRPRDGPRAAALPSRRVGSQGLARGDVPRSEDRRRGQLRHAPREQR